MDASTIIYIVLGLGALILQGYIEKKKKEQARQIRESAPREEESEPAFDIHKELFGFHRDHLDFEEREDELEVAKEEMVPTFEERAAGFEERAKYGHEKGARIEYEMIDIPVAEEGISAFRHEANVAPDEQEQRAEAPEFIIDPKNLILYSEIMTPKFRE